MKTDTTIPAGFAACDYAAEKLKGIGFKHVYTSRKSESCYYQWPGKEGSIRVSTHRFSRSEAHEITLPTMACITFAPQNGMKRLQIVDRVIALAIGQYFLGQMSAKLKRQYKPPAIKGTQLQWGKHAEA